MPTGLKEYPTNTIILDSNLQHTIVSISTGWVFQISFPARLRNNFQQLLQKAVTLGHNLWEHHPFFLGAADKIGLVGES